MSSTRTGIVVLCLLVFGAALGRNSVEPRVVTEEKVEYVDREIKVTNTVREPYVPESCLDMVRYAREYADASAQATDYLPTMTDALSLARKGVASGNSQLLTDSENDLRDVDSKITDQMVRLDNITRLFAIADQTCKEQLGGD